MRAECEWERFTRSGRIEDYLSFKEKETSAEREQEAGEQFYAGFRYRDRNGDQNDTCR